MWSLEKHMVQISRWLNQFSFLLRVGLDLAFFFFLVENWLKYSCIWERKSQNYYNIINFITKFLQTEVARIWLVMPLKQCNKLIVFVIGKMSLCKVYVVNIVGFFFFFFLCFLRMLSIFNTHTHGREETRF